jgi:hypothetical protein
MPRLTMTMTPTMIPAVKTTMAMAASVSAMAGPLTSSRRLVPLAPILVFCRFATLGPEGW